VDTFFYNGKFLQMETPRIRGRGHGGGCILSSYLTANLAKGMGLWEASLAAKASINESIARQYPIGKGMPIVEPLGLMLTDAHRYQVVTRLRGAVLETLGVLTKEWVPEVGTNMVFALPGAARTDDVCALESPIVALRDRTAASGCVAFGASRRMALVVLTTMRFDGGMRAAMNLRCTDEHIRAIRKAGLSIGSFDLGNEPKRYRKTGDWGTEDAIRALGFVPDAIYDRGGLGMEPMIRLLASSPEELVGKMKKLL
jgi:hydroxymethylpyrimidine/phosphomethylpyrimidine kinase